MWGSSNRGVGRDGQWRYMRYGADEYMEEERIEIIEERVVYDWNHQGRSATVKNIRVVKRCAPPPPVWTTIGGKSVAVSTRHPIFVHCGSLLLLTGTKKEPVAPIVLDYNHEASVAETDNINPKIEDYSKVETEVNLKVEAGDNSKVEVASNSKLETEDNSKAEIENNLKIEAAGNSKGEIEYNPETEDNPKVELEGNPKVELEGNPKVELEGNPKVELEGNPKVELEGNPKVEAEYNPKFEAEKDWNGKDKEVLDLNMECRKKRKWDQNTVIYNPLYKAPPHKKSTWVENLLHGSKPPAVNKCKTSRVHEAPQKKIRDEDYSAKTPEVSEVISFKNVPDIDWNEWGTETSGLSARNTDLVAQQWDDVSDKFQKMTKSELAPLAPMEIANFDNKYESKTEDKNKLYINKIPDYQNDPLCKQRSETPPDEKCGLRERHKSSREKSVPGNLNASMSELDVSCISDLSLLPLDNESDIEILFEDTEAFILSDVDFNMYMKGSSNIVNIKSESTSSLSSSVQSSKPTQTPTKTVSRILSCYK